MSLIVKGVVLVGWLGLASAGATTVVSRQTDWVDQPAESHPCQRPCKEGQVMTCSYTFKVEWYYAMSKACYDCPHTLEDCYRPDCVAADGVARQIMTVNRQLPGPSINVCLGDKVEVELENMMNDEATSIHWHGHHQVKSPYMDGVPFITQCPIEPNAVFRYTMAATNPGTHFWHGHTGLQRGSGLFGPLVVRVPDSQNPTSSLYDHDLPEHTFTINDWFHNTDMLKFLAHYHGAGNNKGDAILVNGRGRYWNDSVPLTNTPLAVFTVKKGQRYRFRLINSGVANCPQEMYIDQHVFTAIATDGYDFEPVQVDALVSYAGERWDFVLEANQKEGNYWIRFTGLMDCDERFTKAHQVAVLHYEGAPQVEPREKVGYKLRPEPKRTLNAMNVPTIQPGTLSVPLLTAANKTEQVEVLQGKPDMQIWIAYDFNGVNHHTYHKEPYGFFQVNSTYRRYTPQLNHVTFKCPHSPLLSQYKDIDPSLYCDPEKLKDCATSFCECLYVIDIPSGSKVELILVDQGVTYDANHPFHLHGYAFRVVGMDRLGTQIADVKTVKKMDKEGKIKRNLEAPPFKDTVTVPDGGYTILRFHANNPGYWLFHCHIEFHLDIGMAVVFKIGDPKEFPPVPEGFPKCGDFKNEATTYK